MKNPDPLHHQPFSFTQTKSGLVQISFQGKVVTRLAGKSASQFLARTAGMDTRDQQLLMARATGNFKHGNERPIDTKRQ
jgi:hypothetical protein